MKILMVCLGNICRSPLAEGILSNKINEKQLPWIVDSAGTSSWHIGNLPDSRSIEIAKKNRIDITNQRARQFTKSDFDEFDLILAMDSSNYNSICSLAKNENDVSKVKLLLNYLNPGMNGGVPDPYHDGTFAEVFHLINSACEKLIEDITSNKLNKYE